MFSAYEKLHLSTLATQRTYPSGAGLLDIRLFTIPVRLALHLSCTWLG